MTRMIRRLVAALFLALCSASAFAQVSLTGGTYSQDFNTLAQTGTTNASTTLPTGWLMLETGTNANTTYSAGTGSGNAGDTWSFGVAGTNVVGDRALGGLRSGSLIPVVGACFTNNTGAALTSLPISYTGEQWRLGTSARTPTAERWDFQINTAPGSVSLAATGTWTDVNGLDFSPPVTVGTVGALDGNASANRVALSATINTTTIPGLSIANGSNFCIRWTDVDATGADDGLAIDDFSITAGTAPPTISINDVTQNEGNSGTTTYTFTVSLSSPAGGSGVSFNYETADSTATDADNDYEPVTTTAGSITSGNSSTTISVTVNGDTTPETNETFLVNITPVSGATAGDTQGQGTITNDDIAPNLSINDVTVAEGDSGTTIATFTVSLSSPAGGSGVSFNYATADNTATDADNDYEAIGTTAASIPAGNSSTTISVTVNGDTTVEASESYFVNISGITNAIGTDTQGIGTITADDFHRIHAIQGSGAASPMSGSVRIRAVVTARSGNGFWVQEEDADVDANPLTSEGIFVFTSSAPPAAAAVGNLVEVLGTIFEFGSTGFSLTELTSPTVTLISSGNPLPTPADLDASLPVASTVYTSTTFERFESMRVSAGDLDVVAPNTPNSPNETTGAATVRSEFFVVLAGVPRPMREAGIPVRDDPLGEYPGYTGPVFDENPELLRLNPRGQGNDLPLTTVETGDAIANFVGILDSFQGRYSLLPDRPENGHTLTVVPGAQIVATRDAEYDEFTVAGANLFRLFDTVNDPGSDPLPGATFYNNRLTKASRVICLMMGSPDIIGTVEVEKLEVLQDLAAAIAANTTDCGATPPQYAAYLLTGFDVGGIDVGFLVRTDPTGPTSAPRVEVLDADPGSSELVLQIGRNTLFKDASGTPVSGDNLHDRPSLAMMARIHAANGESEDVTVVVNHLRSLNDSNNEDDPGSNGYATAGARVRAKRHQQAVDLANWIEGRQVANPDERLVLVGDFNAFEFNDGLGHGMGTITGRPVTTDSDTVVPNDTADLVTTDLTNLTLAKPATERYSFMFGGQAQSLDHIVVNQQVLDDFDVDVEHARVNADFLITRFDDFGPNDVTRNADHDPVVLYLQAGSFQIADLAVAVVAPASPVKVGKTAQFGVGVSNGGPAGSRATTLSLVLDAANAGMTATAPSGWTCGTAVVAGDQTTITCSSSDVANGTTPSFNVNVPVTDELSHRTLTLSASVSGTTVDPNLENNNAAAGVATIAEANMGARFQGPNTAVRPNTVVSVPLRVDNYGGNSAVNVVVDVTSNAPASAVSVVTPAGWSCSSLGGSTSSHRCTIARLPRTTVLFTLKVTVPSSFAGSSIAFNASASSDSTDPAPVNNSSSFNLNVRSTGISPVRAPND